MLWCSLLLSALSPAEAEDSGLLIVLEGDEVTAGQGEAVIEAEVIVEADVEETAVLSDDDAEDSELLIVLEGDEETAGQGEAVIEAEAIVEADEESAAASDVEEAAESSGEDSPADPEQAQETI